MIDIKTLKPEDRGHWVRYRHRIEDRPGEYGRIKSWSNFTSPAIWVVYHCDHLWEKFEHYTAESTDPEDVILMPTNCPKDGTLLVPGKALRSTFTGIGDFHEADRVVTMSEGGSGSLVECLKCSECGYSVV